MAAARRALTSASRQLSSHSLSTSASASTSKSSVAEIGRRAALLNAQSLLVQHGQKRHASSEEGPTMVCFQIFVSATSETHAARADDGPRCPQHGYGRGMGSLHGRQGKLTLSCLLQEMTRDTVCLQTSRIAATPGLTLKLAECLSDGRRSRSRIRAGGLSTS